MQVERKSLVHVTGYTGKKQNVFIDVFCSCFPNIAHPDFGIDSCQNQDGDDVMTSCLANLASFVPGESLARCTRHCVIETNMNNHYVHSLVDFVNLVFSVKTRWRCPKEGGSDDSFDF